MNILGGCLCEAVRYEIEGELISLGNCHCKMCQRFHGTAYATYGMIERSQFRFTAGEDLLKTVPSSTEVNRRFCSQCGSPVSYENSHMPTNLWIAAGTFDADPGRLPEYHIFVRSKVPWIEIDDGLPQFEAFPPA